MISACIKWLATTILDRDDLFAVGDFGMDDMSTFDAQRSAVGNNINCVVQLLNFGQRFKFLDALVIKLTVGLDSQRIRVDADGKVSDEGSSANLHDIIREVAYDHLKTHSHFNWMLKYKDETGNIEADGLCGYRTMFAAGRFTFTYQLLFDDLKARLLILIQFLKKK